MNQDSLQKEILDNIKPNPKGRLILAPRVGKTKLIISLIKRDKYKSILWVTPSRELADVDIQNEFIKWKAKSYIKKLTTTTYASLHKIIGKFDIIILDEDQCITENNITNLLSGTLTSNALIGMTGTNTKHTDKQLLYNSLNLPIIYSLDLDTAVDMNILSDYTINVVHVQLDKRKNIQKTTKVGRKWYTSEYDNYSYINELIRVHGTKQQLVMKRLRAIGTSPSKEKVASYLLKHLKDRTICFCYDTEQTKKVCEHTYHSKTDNTDYLKFQNEEISHIAMVNKGGIGYTYLNLKHIIILQADSDKTGLSTQKIARVLLKEDKNAVVWILCLDGTQDERWINSLLSSFDENKINRYTTADLPILIESYDKS